MKTTTVTTGPHSLMIALMAFGSVAAAGCGDDAGGDTMVAPSMDGGPAPSTDGGPEPEPEPCPTGMTGTTCTECAVGFQDEDGDGFCELGCDATGAETLDCGETGTCDDSTGSRACLCDEDYAGATCGECDMGSSLVAGSCVADLGVVEGLALWFDAASTSMTVNDSDEVTAMSSLAADFTMVGPSGNRPTFVDDGLNGRPAIVFDTEGQRLYSTGSTDALAGDDYTVFWVGSRQGLVSGQALYSYRSGDDYGAFLETAGASGFRQVHRAPIGTSGGDQAVTTAPTGQSVQIIRSVRNGSGLIDVLQLGIADGDDLTAHSESTELTTGTIDESLAFVIGDGPDQSFRGSFGELLVYDRTLTGAETDAVMAYLRGKWVD